MLILRFTIVLMQKMVRHLTFSQPNVYSLLSTTLSKGHVCAQSHRVDLLSKYKDVLRFYSYSFLKLFIFP